MSPGRGSSGRPAPGPARTGYPPAITGHDDLAPTSRERAARALYNAAVDLGESGRHDEALATYRQVLDRYGEDPAPALREQTARAIYKTGVRLGALGRYDEALATYREVVSRYGDDPAPGVRRKVAVGAAALADRPSASST